MPHKNPEVRALYHKEYAKRNKEKLQTYRNAYRAQHPDKEKAWQGAYRDSSIEMRKESVRYRRYGVTPEKFEEMLLAQENACAICRSSFTKTPHVDHCHTTGKVRGLLCSSCNTGLGVYEKKANDFKKYLEENG